MTEEIRLIPKIIHQIWIGPHKMPKIWMDTYAVDFMEKFPEWTYMLWTEKEIDDFGLENREFYDNEERYAVKSDIVRFEILKKYGGIYIDADSVWVNNKDYGELIEEAKYTGMFIGTEPELGYGKIYAGGIFGSIPNHEILLELVKNVKVRYSKFGHIFARHVIVGPPYITDTIKELNYKNVTIFPSVYFYPIFWGNIPDVQFHKKLTLPPQSYSFQYGYTTSNLKEKINNFDETNSLNENIEEDSVELKQLEGYIFYNQMDSPGYDLIHLPNKTVEELKKICDSDPSIKGFNTNGWIKSHVVENMDYMPQILKHNKGVYVKNS